VAASYSIVVPPGFVRVLGGLDAGDAVAAVAAQLGEQPDLGTVPAPEDWRLRFGSAFERALAADVHGRVLDSYLSAGPLPGTDIVCSIVVATVPVTRSGHADLDRLLLRRVVTHGADPFLLAGDPAVVWDDLAGDTPSLDGDTASVAESDGRGPVAGLDVLRRRSVLARVAGHDDRLISLVLTIGSATAAEAASGEIHGDADARGRIVDALVDVFDAMVSTFRWRDAESRLVTDRPLA
jgi:hypothetical protein